jgi:predicted branched-subunit amino acid permease
VAVDQVRTSRSDSAAAAGLGLASFALAVSFGTTAVDAGWPAWLVVAMSACVFAGGAQFALVLALAGGAGVIGALGAATMVNLRFIPMTLTAASSLRGGRWRRSLEAQAVVDASWAYARRPDGSIERRPMMRLSLVAWPAWTTGTAVGVLLTPDEHIAHVLALDTVFPAFFLVLVLDALRDEPRQRSVIFTAAVTATAACWYLAPGAVINVAGLAALLTLRGLRRDKR